MKKSYGMQIYLLLAGALATGLILKRMGAGSAAGAGPAAAGHGAACNCGCGRPR